MKSLTELKQKNWMLRNDNYNVNVTLKHNTKSVDRILLVRKLTVLYRYSFPHLFISLTLNFWYVPLQQSSSHSIHSSWESQICIHIPHHNFHIIHFTHSFSVCTFQTDTGYSFGLDKEHRWHNSPENSTTKLYVIFQKFNSWLSLITV